MAESRPAEVVFVSDGDTIGVRRNGTVVPVRLLGIDAPETKGEVECGGVRSSNRLAKLLPRGTEITLVSDPTQDDEDRFGRLLRYVELDGDDLGLRQVSAASPRSTTTTGRCSAGSPVRPRRTERAEPQRRELGALRVGRRLVQDAHVARARRRRGAPPRRAPGAR